MQLSQSSVDEDQAGPGQILFFQPAITPCDHFTHGGEVVVTLNGPDNELR